MSKVLLKYLFLNLLSFTLSISLIQASVKKAGKFQKSLLSAPTTLNPLSSTDYYATMAQGYALESLLTRDPDTYEWIPLLATAWSISENGLEYTFTLREGVNWHDGKPLTIEDVKFSFDAIVDPQNTYKTAHMKPFYEKIEKAIILDKKTIKFIAKEVYFGNFNSVAGLTVLPRHIYEKPSKEQEKKLNKILIGTGAYKLKNYKRSKITFERNKNWWGVNDPYYKKTANFNQIVLRVVKDGTIALQRLERGELDFHALTPEEFVKKTKSSAWTKKLIKQKVENSAPSGYSFIGWNLTNPMFKSIKTRKALGMLMNRDLMIEKFEFNLQGKGLGPLYGTSPYVDQSLKPLEFNIKEALNLLREDGWADTDNDRILDKMIDGKKVSLSFTILEPRPEFMKYLTIYKEDAKKAGVDINLKIVEWNSFIKLLDERKFEAVRLAWGGGSIDWDPKQIWHSSSIANAGSNFISYKNPEVDKLIDEARSILDPKKRMNVLKKVYRLIANDHPYAFFFSKKYQLYGISKKIGQDSPTKRYELGEGFWWLLP